MYKLRGCHHRLHAPFCGTKYNGGAAEADFDEDQYTGTLKVDGKEYQVYIGRMEDSIIFRSKGLES